jgi:hypothetical protein
MNKCTPTTTPLYYLIKKYFGDTIKIGTIPLKSQNILVKNAKVANVPSNDIVGINQPHEKKNESNKTM